MKNAWIYILNHSSGQTVKVGETRVSPNSREKDYIKTYKLKGFKLYKSFNVPINARKDIERRTHKKLKQFQLSGIERAREIFSCSAKIAEEAILKSIKESDAYRIELRKQKIAQRKRIEQEKIEKIKNKILKDFEIIIESNWIKTPIYNELAKKKYNLNKQHPFGNSGYDFGAILFIFIFGSNFLIGLVAVFRDQEFFWAIGSGFILFLIIYFIERGKIIDDKNEKIHHQHQDKMNQAHKEFYKKEFKNFETFYKKNLNKYNQ